MRKRPSPFFTALFCGLVAVVVIGIVSCSPDSGKFTLAWKFEPAGKVTMYKLETHRVGTYYRNGDEYTEDFESKTEADVIYTTKELLPDGAAFIEEINRWSWDEKCGDSGQIKRSTREFIYDLHMTRQGKVLSFRRHKQPQPGWINYIKQYYEQCMPIFPEEGISVGHSWTQDATSLLPDSTTVEVSTRYTIKGKARKMGYECAIIEYKGDCALAITRNPADSTDSYGVDWIEYNGILYYAIDAGISIQSEEKRHVVSERHSIEWPKYTKGPDGKKMEVPPEKRERVEINARTEFDEVISYKLESIEGT